MERQGQSGKMISFRSEPCIKVQSRGPGRSWRISGLRALVLETVDGKKTCMTLRTLNYGKYGIFLIMGNAGFCPSTGVQGLGF